MCCSAGSRKRTIAPSIAPGNPSLGVMLPYTPLHHILLRELVRPARCHQRQSLRRAHLHRRTRGCRLGYGRLPMRFWSTIDRSSGRLMIRSCAWCWGGNWCCVAPGDTHLCRWRLPQEVPDLLAVGAQLKSAVAVARGRRVFLSQHLGRSRERRIPSGLRTRDGLASRAVSHRSRAGCI